MVLEITAKKKLKVDDEYGYPKLLSVGDSVSYDVDSVVSDIFEDNTITAYKEDYPIVTFVLDEFSFDLR